MPMTYSMVLLDVDGTLLDSKLAISPNTKRLLNRLEKRGVPVVLCSARSPSGVELVERQAELHGPIACYGGSLVLASDRSILADEGIQVDTAVRFKEFVREHFTGIVSSAWLYDVWLVDDAADPLVLRDAQITQCEPLAGALEMAVRAIPHVHKLLCTGTPRQIAQLQAEAVRMFPEMDFLRSGTCYLEVVKKGVSKCTAMDALRTAFHLPREAVAACGDHFIDLELLRQAGMGIAMGNAPEQVKAAADRVTASNDDEGVYIALKLLKFAPPELAV